MRNLEILGVRVDNFSKKELLEKIEGFLEEEKFHQVATINPEFILKAQKDESFRNILNSCDLNVADGTGIWFAHLRFGKFLKKRIAGADLMEEILKLAERNNHRVFLLADKNGLSGWKETGAAISKKHPRLKIDGIDLDKSDADCRLPLDDCQILFCSFGAPEQEKLIHSLKSQKESKIRLAMGVGGSFDFLTGRIRRAPRFLQALGLEWLWRFIQEPRYRAKRIWNATVIFPLRIIANK